VLVHRWERGELWLWRAGRNVIVVKHVGYAEGACVAFLAEAFDTVSEGEHDLDVFIDCQEQTGFDMAFRDRVADWARSVQPRVRSVCALVRSRIVGFGVAVVSVLIGRITTMVATEEAFARKLAAAVRGSLEDDDAA